MHNHTNKTYIIGKDAALEDSIQRLQTALRDNGFNIVEHTWSNPAPNVWWVHLRDADCPLCFTNGKGASKPAALASALGEYIERLSCNYFFADYHLGERLAHADFVHYADEKWFAASDKPLSSHCPEGLLDAHLQTFYDPDATLRVCDLIDINSGYAQRGICAIPFVRQSDNVTVYIPVNIIGNLYVSNGMSAGNSVAEARTQALSEIFERYVKNKIIAEGIALPEIPASVLQKHPKTAEAIVALQAEGYLIHAFDASLGGQFPVVCVTLLNRDNGGCFASFGAHPTFSVALERTVTELLQGRSLSQLDVFSPPTFEQDLVADHHNLETHFIDSSGLVGWDLFRADKDYTFVDWDFGNDSQQQCDYLLKILQQLDTTAYIADYTHLGVYACRVIVPGISEIYPIEELTQYNNNIGHPIRETVLTLPTVYLESPDNFAPVERVLAWLDDSGLDDSELLRQVLGFAADADSAWANLRVGELRCLLFLAIGAHEDALDMAEWVMMFAVASMPKPRQRFFACLIEQLQLALDERRDAEAYAWVQRELYGEAIYHAAQAHVNRQAAFYGLTAVDKDYTVFDSHRRLLTAYDKLQAAKLNDN